MQAGHIPCIPTQNCTGWTVSCTVMNLLVEFICTGLFSKKCTNWDSNNQEISYQNFDFYFN